MGWLARAAAALLLAAGCNPKDFDDAVAHAPVTSLSTVSGYGSPDVGRVVLALPPPMGVAGRVLAAGAQRGALALYDFDATGKLTKRNIADASVKDLLIDVNAPAGSAALLGNGDILIGEPNFGVTPTAAPLGRTVLLNLMNGADGSVAATMSRHLEPTFARKRLGMAVATGRVTGGNAEDQVILSEDALALVPGGDTNRKTLYSSSCDLVLDSLPTAYGFRALGVGDLLEAGQGQTIAVGVPRDGGTGGVALIDVVDGDIHCEMTIKPSSNGANERHPRFGAALAVADLDGDGKRNELVVGSADDRVYVYRGPFMAGAMPDPVLTITPPDIAPGVPAGEFGLRVAVADVDPSPGPEIVVAAPSMAVNGKNGAGQVFVFSRQGTLLAKLADHDPEEQGGFGLSLTDMRFAGGCGAGGADQHLLVVGADKELFVFFRLPTAPQDARCPAKM